MYVNVIFAKNMFKNHFDPICDALEQKVLKIILKNLTFEIMDVKTCPVRNVSDGTEI